MLFNWAWTAMTAGWVIKVEQRIATAINLQRSKQSMLLLRSLGFCMLLN
jgi:hypothetical protein